MEWMRDDFRELTQRKYRSTKQEFYYLPTAVAELRFKCEKGHEYKPNWLKKCLPVKPILLDNGLLALPTATYQKCKVCDGNVRIPTPTQAHTADGHFFGDEAMRISGDKFIATYTIVASPLFSERRDAFVRDYFAIKKSLCPNLNPTEWTLHCKDLRSGQYRDRSPDFFHLSKGDIEKLFVNLGELLQRHKLVIWNSSGAYIKQGNFKRCDQQGVIVNSGVLDCWSCSDLAIFCGFNSVFERDACDDFCKVIKAA